MGNMCSGQGDAVEGFEEGDHDEDMDDWGAERAQLPSQTVAYNINKLPNREKQSGKLLKLQELINTMKANERRGKKMLQITRQHGEGKPLDDPYLIRFNNSIYIGEWKYSTEINSTVPGGLGRLYKEDEIMEGEIITYIPDEEKNKGDLRNNLAEQMIRETKRRAKFFNKEKDDAIDESTTEMMRNIRIALDGQGRVFSRSKEESGYFTQGKLNGKGEVSIKYDKETYVYHGEFKNGKKHGKGVQTYKNVVYDGQFTDDLKEGKGILTLFISHKYNKEVEEEEQKLALDNAERSPKDMINLIEEFIKLKEDTFETPLREAIAELAWKPPERKKKILLFFQDPNFILERVRREKFPEQYKGQFDDNQFHGYGRYTWFNGKCYEGEWKNGKMHGMGQFFWQKGAQYYDGEYVDDLKHGKGTMYWGLTRRYRGNWAYGFRHGYGQLIEVNQIEPQEQAPQQQVSYSLLGGLNRLKQKMQGLNPLSTLSGPKKRAQVLVIGGIFNKDHLQQEYFRKTYTIYTDLFKIKKKQKQMTCFLKGIRFDEDEFKEK